ncbi:pilus assembly protein PilN [Vibrio albus]|uniref:Pilus assembly protein PilN n=1 Tax=Vibrio albus TaxID=2200953 RepID=A0A2U3B8M3_9VIBR|nr:PilN domain-containing protein [Vibrio albus]PWI33121.1 pilus assembly protein PilN [Vibrio albus]
MPHKVNLLSWREEQRERHKKRFLTNMVFGVLVAAGLQWLAGYYIDYQQSRQRSRIEQLHDHVAVLDKKIEQLSEVESKHSSILTKLAKVEELQHSRNKTTEFMNLMPQLVPHGVYVDKIKMNGTELEMAGISDSTARLATMLDNFENSEFIADVEMHSIVHGDKRFGRKFQSFSMSFYFIASDSEAVDQSVTVAEEEKHG